MTREQAYELAESISYGDAVEPCDVECALYWFAANYHLGQWSEHYSILSTSPYRPGPLENGPEPESFAAMLYEVMVYEETK